MNFISRLRNFLKYKPNTTKIEIPTQLSEINGLGQSRYVVSRKKQENERRREVAQDAADILKDAVIPGKPQTPADTDSVCIGAVTRFLTIQTASEHFHEQRRQTEPETLADIVKRTVGDAINKFLPKMNIIDPKNRKRKWEPSYTSEPCLKKKISEGIKLIIKTEEMSKIEHIEDKQKIALILLLEAIIETEISHDINEIIYLTTCEFKRFKSHKRDVFTYLKRLKTEEMAGQETNKEETPTTEVTKEEPAVQPIEEPLEKPETPDVSDPPETQETIQNSTIESNDSFSTQSQADRSKDNCDPSNSLKH
jgi:hypothetical protein